MTRRQPHHAGDTTRDLIRAIERAGRDHTFREQWYERIENDPDIPKRLLFAAYAIARRARNDGTRAVISHKELARVLGIASATAERRTHDLRGLAYLTLVEPGGRRGNKVTANMFDLSLRPVPTHHLDEGLGTPIESPTHQNEGSQPIKTGSQPITLGDGPPRIPHVLPHDARATSAAEGAPASEPEGSPAATDKRKDPGTGSSGNGKSPGGKSPTVRASDKTQDQKPDKPVWRCKECHCHNQGSHDRAIELGISPDHPWMPQNEATASRQPRPGGSAVRERARGR